MIYEQNADKLFQPASNTKLFTTAAALALLGSDYKFQTTVESAAAPDKDGRLKADLVIVGRGDPNLSGRVLPYHLKTERMPPHVQAFEDLADQVVRSGIKVVEGDVIGDDTFFVYERYPEGWAIEDMVWDYGAPVSALCVNDNVFFLNIKPGEKVGDKAQLTLEPFTDYYKIDNRIETVAGPGRRNIAIDRQPGSDIITLWGTIPVADKGEGDALAIQDPADYIARLFKTMLQNRGVVFYGDAKARHFEAASLPPPVDESVTPPVSQALGRENPAAENPVGEVPAVEKKAPVAAPATAMVVLARHESLPLIEDLRVIEKVSQNLHVEMVLRLLGKEKKGLGSLSNGLEVMKRFLAQVGLTSGEYTFFDGSGLSRQNLVAPEATVKLLRYMVSQPFGKQYAELLPIAGTDGSLSDRLKNSGLSGRVMAKTGSFSHTNSLSGYATTVSGKNIVFSIMLNHHTLRGRQAIAYLDQVVEAVVKDKK